MNAIYCEDEGCPQHGTKHVCVIKVAETDKYTDKLSDEFCRCGTRMTVGEAAEEGMCMSCYYALESGAD